MKFTEFFEMIEAGQLIRVYLPNEFEGLSRIDCAYEIGQDWREVEVELDESDASDEFLSLIHFSLKSGERNTVSLIKTNKEVLCLVIQ